MLFDPDNDPCELLNVAELDETPIGTLRVLSEEGTPVVWIMDPHEPMLALAPVHILKPGGSPFAAAYGKRFFERAAVFQSYDAVRAMQKEAKQRGAKLLGGDTKRELTNFANDRHHDAHEAINTLLGYKQ